MQGYQFTDENGSFQLEGAENDLGLYFPIAGEHGLKSAITPNLAGDAKLDQNHFLLEPTSIGDLVDSRSSRNFWCAIEGAGVWSATGMSAEQEAARFTAGQDTSKVEAGLMWHKVSRSSKKHSLHSEITSFVAFQNNVEVMQVKLTNTGKEAMTFTAYAAIPIYGRSADNIRDHRHVTSLLHRAITTEYGVHVTPTLSFDERGHQVNDTTYFVEGITEDGKAPVAFYPEQNAFVGKAGTLLRPEAVVRGLDGVPASSKVDGQEICGAFRFEKKMLAPGESTEYTVLIGATKQDSTIEAARKLFCGKQNVYRQLDMTKQYWLNKINVHYHSGDNNFDQFMNWVSFQPELRRIYGCSFLPHHDYGRGGRGWRDLWQDCLALLMMNPGGVRQMLLSNFGGVRVDGSNATIIGDHLGEFKADRNSITRVWMDHGVWPFMTTKLYMNQTGDFDLLYQKVPYFKDGQVMRGKAVDEQWKEGMQWQESVRGVRYEGTVLEHLLIQALGAFYEVGEHNHIALRDADWNDALDMAGHRGESVAFTNAYAMNLRDLAAILRQEAAKGVCDVELLEEITKLLEDREELYESIEAKHKLLNSYLRKCRHTVSGVRIQIDTKQLADSLEHKAEWMMEHIRETEWVSDAKGHGWYNGYYDDHGNRVEGVTEEGNVRMMLTGQVFSIMAGTATEEQVRAITEAADAYLYDASCGGYRLNTDFHELKTDMGRMFGFAFGEKENGAVFSHMAVMYANALYTRGFAKEGYKALDALYRQSMDFETSRIYPGIPEYFGKDGRGLYHYLTGAASWYMLTVITQMFGVHGEAGGLAIRPQLLLKQFDAENKAAISLKFMGITWELTIENPNRLEVGSYVVGKAYLDGTSRVVNAAQVRYTPEEVRSLDDRKVHHVRLILMKKIRIMKKCR